MHWQPSANLTVLRQRALLLQHIRQWFNDQGVLEVETPQISAGATTDPHIDSFAVSASDDIGPDIAPDIGPYISAGTGAGLTRNNQPVRHLRTSAEFHMKRLLASGSGDIYELGKVFRVDESGRYHNPEFTMLEWYRVGLNHHQLIDDVENLLKHLHTLQADNTGYPGLERISYRNLWKTHCNIDIANASCAELKACLEAAGCDVPDSIADDFDTLLDLGMSSFICDQLPADKYTCIVDYPASQASLARIDYSDSNFAVACRFEFYFGSVELANGYHELTDAAEQRKRFEADNAERQASGKPVMPIDQAFLKSLEAGLPDCAGVAIGIDRLLMILLPQVNSLSQVVAFNWDHA